MDAVGSTFRNVGAETGVATTRSGQRGSYPLTTTSASRLLHFRDTRSPHAIQCDLERDHMVLFRPTMENGHLQYAVDSRINGVPYRILLRYEAALANTHCYSIFIEISWQDQPASAHDYHVRSSAGWLDLWLNRYTPSNAAPGSGRSEQRYRDAVAAAVSFESHLVDVPAVQQAILQGLRDGGSFSTSHKEGGTRLLYGRGSYMRSDYGDNVSSERYPDETTFLASLRQFYDWQTSRPTYPKKVDELTAWKLILRLLDPPDGNRAPFPGSSGRTGTSSPPTGFNAAVRSRFALLLAGVAAAAAIGWGALSEALAVKTTGSPVGAAAGSAAHVAMLISTQVPYLPSLHRDASKDRYRIGLLVEPRHSGDAKRLIPVLDDLDASQSLHAAQMLGFDGRIFWFLAKDIAGYDPAAKRLVRIEDLKRANPGLEALWGVAQYEVQGRLIANTRDRRVIVEVDPDTLTVRNLDRLPPRKHVLPPHPAEGMLTSAPPTSADKLKAAYVRQDYGQPALRLSNPESSLLLFWRKTGTLQRMLYLARVATDGTVVWEVETGIDELQQVLPDASAPALIGTRPRVPDKVSEPILVIVDASSGKVDQRSLWIAN